MKNLLLLMLLVVVSTGCAQKNDSVLNKQPADFAQKLKLTSDAQLIDVRTSEEYAEQHLPNSVNVDWNGENFEQKMSKYDKTKPVFVYCRSGGRSSKAADKLAEMGFSEVYNMEGGITKWNEDGMSRSYNPTQKP